MALTVSVGEIVAGSNNPVLQGHPGWQRVRLGDVASIQNGGAFESSLFSKSEGTPLIRIRDIASTTTETRYNGEFDPCYVVQPGDLLIGMDGDFNCARWQGEPGLLNQRVCRVRIHSADYDERFLDYVLPGFLKAINDATSSVTVKHLSSRTVADIPLPLPPKEQQRHIAAELDKQFSRLDEAVAGLQRVKANLKRYKAAILKAAVEGRLVPTEADLARREGRDYETGTELLHRILETRRRQWQGKGKYKGPAAPDTTDLPELPEGWVWASLDALSWDSAYGTSEKCSYENTGIAVLRIPNVQNGALDLDDLKFASPALAISASEAVAAGDMLIIRTNGSKSLIGRAAVVLASPIGILAYASYLIRFRLMNLESLAHWVSVVWQGPPIRSWIEAHAATSAGQHNISMTTLANAAVPLPPLVEQHRIVAEVDRLLSIAREAEAEVEANLKRAQTLRQSVLSAAFSG